MKKKLRTLCCILLALVLTFGISAPASAAASARYQAAVKAYHAFLARRSGPHAIADIDGNGIPELMLFYNYTNYVYTYNYSARKMVGLSALQAGKGYNLRVKYNTKSHRYALSTANTGGSCTYIFQLKGQKAVRVHKFQYYNTKSYNPFCGGLINGKRVRTSTYNILLNRMLQGYKTLPK